MAQDGKKMTFQGSLFQTDQPFNGTTSLEFSIMLDSVTTWSETLSEVTVVNGLYSVVLGETTPLPTNLFEGVSERMLNVKVDGTDLGAVTIYAPFSSGDKPMLPLDLPGANGNRSIMLSSEGETGDDGILRLSNASGFSRVTMFANRYDSDSTGARVYSDAGGVWFGGANGSKGAFISSDGPENSNGYMELADKNGATQVRTGIYEDVDGQTFGNLSLRGSDGSEFNISSHGIDYGDMIQLGNPDSGTYSQTRPFVYRIKNNNDPYSAVYLNRFEDGHARLQVAGHQDGQSTGVSYLGAGHQGGYMYVGGTDPTNILRAGMYVQDNFPHLFMQGTFDVEGDTLQDQGGADSLTYYRPELVNMDVNQDQDGNEYGSLSLKGTDGSMFNISSHGIDFGDNFQIGDPANGSYSQVRPGIFRVKNDNDQYSSVYLNRFGDGQTRLQLTNHDSTGIATGTTFVGTNSNGGYLYINGQKSDGSGNTPMVDLYTYNADPSGNEYSNGYKRAGVDFYDNEGNRLAALGSRRDENGQDPDGASGLMILWGKEGKPNIESGGKTWENADLPYISMKGDMQLPGDTIDTVATFYNPDLVWMDVQRWDDGRELGHLTLRSTDGTELNLSPYGIQGWSPDLNSTDYTLKHEWSDEKVGELIARQNGAQLNIGGIINQGDTAVSYGGGFSAGTKFWDEWNGNSPQLGYLHVRGSVNEANYFDANMKFAMEAVNRGDTEEAEFKMYGSQLNEYNQARSVLRMNTVVDGSGQSTAEFHMEGATTPNIMMGAKTWEVQGSELPFFKMNGTTMSSFNNDNGTPDDASDDFEDFYPTDLIWMDVARWYDGSERGSLRFSGTNGIRHSIDNGMDEIRNEGGSGTYTQQMSSVFRVKNDADPFSAVYLNRFDDGQARLQVAGHQDGQSTGVSYLGAGHQGGYMYIGGTDQSNNLRAGMYVQDNLPHYFMQGTFDVQGEILQDQSGADSATYYRPELVNIDVVHNEDGSQNGSLVLRGTDGSQFGVNSHGFMGTIESINTSELISYGNHWRMSSFGLNGDENAEFNVVEINNGQNLGTGAGEIKLFANDGSNGAMLDGWGNATFTGEVTATTLTQSSDKRFKKDLNQLEGVLSKISGLNGYTYFWNRTANEEKGIKDESQQIGLIAQEVEKVFPQLVKTDDEGFKSVNYAQMTAVLIEAVKELNAKVETLESENTDLKAQVEASANLENRLEQIEKLLGVKINETSSANNK